MKDGCVCRRTFPKGQSILVLSSIRNQRGLGTQGHACQRGYFSLFAGGFCCLYVELLRELFLCSWLAWLPDSPPSFYSFLRASVWLLTLLWISNFCSEPQIPHLLSKLHSLICLINFLSSYIRSGSLIKPWVTLESWSPVGLFQPLTIYIYYSEISWLFLSLVNIFKCPSWDIDWKCIKPIYTIEYNWHLYDTESS